ncbi:MAG: hypothetical protein U0798_15125 [Gemmataceae bacterium]
MNAEYHRNCCQAVADLIEAARQANPNGAGFKDLQPTKVMDSYDGNLAASPVAITYLMAQAQPEGGSMRRDDWKFPVVAAVHTSGVLSGNRAGPEPTDFLGAIAGLFHGKRPAGLPSEVWKCEIDPQGMAATDEAKYQNLSAATVVVLTARLNR